MTIKTRISLREYLKLLFTLTYKKPMMIVILCVDLAMITWIIGYYTGILPVPKPALYQFTTLILITIVQPTVIFTTIRKNYKSSGLLKEPLEIEFTQKEIKMRGESFYTELVWEKIYKVDELSNWFLIYQNTLSAVIIPKRCFNDEQAKDFRQLLNSITGLSLHLKEIKSNFIE